MLLAGDTSENPHSGSPDYHCATPCSDGSPDHPSPPAPIPNRRQHARVIFKIKLYSFGNKNIGSAHQCTSSHLKTAEHIGHKVFRGGRGRSQPPGKIQEGQTEALPSPVRNSTASRPRGLVLQHTVRPDCPAPG